MIFILGGDGFVGSAYVRLLARLDQPLAVINRDNYAQFVGRRCDLLINANGNSKKFMAGRDPMWEFDASTRSVVQALEDFPSETYIQLSTGDVYPRQDSPDLTREDLAIDLASISRYGLHKLLAEYAVRAVHPRHLIFRMGGFVGPGLKKNAIFDLLHDQPLWLSLDSALQFLSTDAAAEMVWAIYQSGLTNQVINLSGAGVVGLGDLARRLGSPSQVQPDARSVRYELSLDRLSAVSPIPVPASQAEVERFLCDLGR